MNNRKLKTLITFLGGSRLSAKLRVNRSKKNLLANAKNEFKKQTSLGNIDDYKQSLRKHWVSYSEYAYQYEFFKKEEKERDEYISRLKMRYFYMRYSPKDVIPLFQDKEKFLSAFNKQTHRRWVYAPNSSFEEFTQLVSNYDCIIKPNKGSLGKGISKTCKNLYNNKNKIRELYDFCVENKMMVEQCVDSCDELKAFHPQSLNTLRIVTISNKGRAEVFGGCFRMGAGDSIIDNAHAGGVFAQINVKDGIVESDGIDVNGNKFIYHPNSKLKLKGFKIPQWNTIIETCCEAAKLTKNYITGWDVAINAQGEVEIIEGNCWPDIDIIQSPQKGIKKEICALIKKYYGIEMD